MHYNLKKEIASILRDTNGQLEYKEQVIAIVREVGGFGSIHADFVGRLLIKKLSHQESIFFKQLFMLGSADRGFDKKEQEDLWEMLIKNAPKVKTKSLDFASKIAEVKK